MNLHQDETLETRCSCQLECNSIYTNGKWKSDICLNDNNNNRSYTVIKATGSNITKRKEYYKRYEHDEVPVKDSTNSIRKGNYIPPVKLANNENKSITNSDLDRLEENIYKNISQELHMEHDSASSVASNFKMLKMTLEEIFNNFQSNMPDFDLYKKKLTEILTKTQTESIADMENFIKDLIHNIISAETSTQSLKTNDNDMIKSNKIDDQKIIVEVKDEGSDALQENESKTDDSDDSNRTSDNASCNDNIHLVLEAYKNDSYLTDSSLNDNNSKSKNRTYVDNRAVNVYLLSNTPCIIKMNNRSLLSEINIKDTSTEVVSSYVASTENIKKMAAKKLEIERYEMQPQEMPDREIPVKVSFAKKNLWGCDDVPEAQTKEIEESSKSFISKICYFLCRKFRKNSLG